ncbi:MAG: hypothetical protein ACXWKY_09145 [Caulobacteraceae bacterium]
MIAFLAASLNAGRTFTHVYDHDAGREIPVGGIVRPDRVEVIEGLTGARIAGEPKALFHSGSRSYIQLSLEGGGFSGYDHGSASHFRGLFQDKGTVQLFDHQTGRYHAFHVS